MTADRQSEDEQLEAAARQALAGLPPVAEHDARAVRAILAGYAAEVAIERALAESRRA